MREGPLGFWDAWELGTWRPHSHAVLRRLLSPRHTLVDIGAWIGPVVCWASPLCRQVIALEPDPVAFGMLATNVAGLSNVVIRQAALTPMGGPVRLYHRGAFGESMSSLIDTGNDGSLTVMSLSVRDLFNRVPLPAVVNMNCEGSEALLLPHLAPLLVSSNTPLILSVHEPWSGPDGVSSINAALDGFSSVERLHTDGPGFYELLALPT